MGVFAVLAAGAATPALALADTPPAAVAAPDDHLADYRKGVEALHAGKLDEAQAAALALLDAQPQQAPGRQLLGLVKVKKGDLAGAIGEFDKALTNDPKFIPAREERAVTLARLGQSAKARVDLEALKSRAASCARTCPPELRTAVSRVEAALAAGRPAARKADVGADLRTRLARSQL
jgi:tetratricopeptide (TPR) repeat protein